LFIEQCHRFLKPDGFLAVVIPDGILTNSSMQYVRDWIADHYRIVAVVSLPQHTFTATGAGVKSSVLFLRKLPERDTNRLREAQRSLQDRIAKQTPHKKNIERLESEKDSTLKEHTDFDATLIDWQSDANIAIADTQASIDGLQARERKKRVEKTAEFKAWKKEIADDFNEQIADEKERLEEAYNAALNAEMADYPIFMAIADNIGYDATGRTTAQNDIPRITEELFRFIEEVIAGRDSFFV
jgi:type I restriction enzyme M protein